MLTNEMQFNISQRYICSITGQIMIDPVFTADGQTYEREAIEQWLKTHNTSPKTGANLDNKTLTPNWDKKSDIAEFLEKHPELYDEEDEIYLPKSWVAQLTQAIKNNQITEVQNLLAKDRRLLTTHLEEKYTAFHLACEFGSLELANILLESCQKKNVLNVIEAQPSGFNPVHLNALLQKSLEKKDKPKFILLLKLGADIEQPEVDTQNTLLHRLVIQGAVEPVEWLLELEQKPSLELVNREGNTPLLLSVLHNHVELTEFLLKKDANIKVRNAKEQNPVLIALLNQNQPILSLLVGTISTLPPLHMALELNDNNLLKSLLKETQSLEITYEERETPFYAAVQKGNIEAAKLLLEKGANPMIIRLTDLETPLHAVALRGDLSMLKFLLQTKLITLIDSPNDKGDTPLHFVSKKGYDNLIPLLLEAGADHKIKNHKDQTPIDLARQDSNPKTANLIEQKARALKKAKFEKIEVLQTQIEQLNNTLQDQKKFFENAIKQEEKKREIRQTKFDQDKKFAINLFYDFKKASKPVSLEKNPLIKTLSGHTNGISCLQLLPTGEFVSASRDNTLKFWDLKTGNCLKTLSWHASKISCLQSLPTGELVSCSNDGTIKIWDLKAGICLKTLTDDTKEPIYFFKLINTDKLVSYSSRNDKSTITLSVWDLKTGISCKSKPIYGMNNVQILPSGGLIGNQKTYDDGVHSNQTSVFNVFDLNGTCIKRLELPWSKDYFNFIVHLQLSGETLFICLYHRSEKRDAFLMSWNLGDKDPKYVRELPDRCSSYIDSPYGMIGLGDRKIQVNYDNKIETGHSVRCVEFTTKGELVSGSSDKTIKVWNLNGNCLKTLTVANGEGVSSLHSLASGEMVSLSEDGALNLWDLKTGECLKTLSWHTSHVTCLQRLSTGEMVTSSDDTTIKVWDLNNGNCFKTLKGHNGGVHCFQFLSTGELVSGSDDKTIKVWDLKTGACLKTLSGHTGYVKCLQLLPSGELISGSGDNMLKVWDLKTGNCLKTMAGHAKGVNCLELLATGEQVSGSEDGTIKVWDLKTGNCLKTLTGHTDAINCLQFLSTGELISGSSDRSLKIWDIQHGSNCIKTITGHTQAVTHLQLLPTGELVSGSSDQTLKVWDLNVALGRVLDQDAEKELEKCALQ